MTLYNRPLENALVSYLQKNRTKEERQSLWLMRIYRLGEIIWYYTKLLDKTSDNIKLLTEARIDFWTKVLEATLAQKQVSKEEVNNYIKIRNSLRSEEEKIRQQKLH